MKKITLLSLLIIFCASCGTANSRDNDYEAVYQRSLDEIPSSSGNQDWVSSRKEKIDEGDRVAFIGSSVTKRTKKEATDWALDDAFKKISRHFGVSVSAIFYHKDTQINGKYDDISTDESTQTSKKIEVKEFDIEDSSFEHRGNGWVAHVKLAVPKTELARIQIETDGFGVWAIKSDIPQCEKKIRDLFPVFSSRLGVSINDQIDYSSKTPKQIFAENQKAFYLKVECAEPKAMEHSGEFYSIIELKAELFNLMTGKTINRWNIEAKGAAYSAKDAQEDGITKAVQEIGTQIK